MVISNTGLFSENANNCQDPRQTHFAFRKQCYDLIANIVVAVDGLDASDPGVIDGQYTPIAKRRKEAYSVISESDDEVFLTSLYDWYLEQGWNDRLLATKSSFVVKYLERKSADDIYHADLLWRFYGQTERYYDAARVQYQLAQSAFTLRLNRRIEYLGQARANASTYTPEVNRQSRQKLLQEIGNLLDVATIQDDLLQHLKEDDRISGENKEAILAEVDGPILDLTIVSLIYCIADITFLMICSFSINMPMQEATATFACRFTMRLTTETRLTFDRRGRTSWTRLTEKPWPRRTRCLMRH